VRAVVVGAGVVGLTTAVRLREAGIEASVVARDEPRDTTSAVAAALWYPYRACRPSASRSGRRRPTRRSRPSPRCPAAAVRMLAGTERLAPDAPDPWWREAVPSLERTREGLRFARPPSTCRSTCRGWSGRLRALGGAVQRRGGARSTRSTPTPSSTAPASGARELAGDDSLVAVRGQVVRVAAPEVSEWLLDQSDPHRSSTVVPRERDVVLGGTARRAPRTARPTRRRRTRSGALRGARSRAARRAGARRRGRAAPGAPGGALGGRGPRRALLRPRRRGA
jgi:D-amino-acid oxidase